MTVIGVTWTPKVNVLLIQCDCGNRWVHASNYSAAKCRMCDRFELWHGVDPKPTEGIWSIKEMRIDLD